MLYNVREYHRPTDLGEAIRLLNRPGILTVPLAGGVTLVGEGTPEIEAVVDLDGLGLDFIEEEGGTLGLGAMIRLQAIVERLSDIADGILSEAARRMAGWHVRNASTLGGALAGGDAHSPLGVVLAVLGATVHTHDGRVERLLPWIELASLDATQRFQGCLLTAVTLALPVGVGSAYEQVARTPADHPIVAATAVVKPATGGQLEATIAVGGLMTRLVVVHQVATPDTLDSLIGQITPPESGEADFLSDFRGSAEYRRGIAPVLARRALHGALIRAGLRPG
jgi:CO/xanthine dehydrogenase FAD-binding subunit